MLRLRFQGEDYLTKNFSKADPFVLVVVYSSIFVSALSLTSIPVTVAF